MMVSQLMNFAVIGLPIEHSLSPLIHQAFAKALSLSLNYEKIVGHLEDFEKQVLQFFDEGGRGLNITAPFKERAFLMAQQRSARCEQAKAANTLWMENGVLHADNTDGYGFLQDISRFFSLKSKRVLILGAGGAAKGLVPVLLENKVQRLVLASRKEFILPFSIESCLFESLFLEEGFDLVIHATSARSFEFLPESCLINHPFCYDLTYNEQQETPFVAYAKRRGCAVADGLGMLIEQAAESFKVWHGIAPDTSLLFKKFLHGFRTGYGVLKP